MTWYALASVKTAGAVRTGLVFDGHLFDLERTAESLSASIDWARSSVDELLARWTDVSPQLDRLAEDAATALSGLEELTVGPNDLAPPLRPGRFFCAAANYIEHANEMGTVLAAKSDSNPYMFIKPDTSLIGHNDTVIMPAASAQVDWEIELAAVIGREARHIAVQQALDYVAGYSVVNDVSARDLNVRVDFPFKTDWLQGKCFDTFAPLGPWFVPSSCIEDPHNLQMELAVNGEVMQDANTGAMIFDIREQIAYLSSILTLKPGDVLATGTPTGVGMARGIYLKPGDVMTASIESIGTLRNPVAAESRQQLERSDCQVRNLDRFR